MPFMFTRDCAGDLGIIIPNKALDIDLDLIVAILFHRAPGCFPVYDILAGGEPTIHATLPAALDHMTIQKKAGGIIITIPAAA